MSQYTQTIDFLFSQLPMFQRQGAAAYKADLSNTIALMDMLKQPQKAFPAVHIAGTNGKGSSAHMIASILQQQGYKTGLYTSPHLVDFRERIKVNGEMISEEAVVEFVNVYKEQFTSIRPSFFEITFAMALDYFRAQNVDIVVMETGMGGRLDSSNVVEPIVSLITNIGLDHTQFLGDTLEKIAGEKAGIIKKNVPV
ncbi:MAG: bifunctional folylpolyglutamate synthase/dihydrofolate synthase, partial [Bacteroidetes bacterium]